MQLLIIFYFSFCKDSILFIFNPKENTEVFSFSNEFGNYFSQKRLKMTFRL
jgi:hypothetical protein